MDELPVETAAEDRVALIDLIDHLLDKGVVLQAELTLGLADVDLVLVRLSALLTAIDRVAPDRSGDDRLPPPSGEPR